MTRLLPTPSLWRLPAAVASPNPRYSLARVRKTTASSPVQAGGKCGVPPQSHVPCREAATPCPRHTAALPSSSLGVAQLFLTSVSASLADQRRTDKTSNPDWANHLPGHPAPFVRFVRTVGSPQSCSGARYRRSTISGRFRGRNLVGLGPQSKCFFSYRECGPLMRPPHDHGPGDA